MVGDGPCGKFSLHLTSGVFQTTPPDMQQECPAGVVHSASFWSEVNMSAAAGDDEEDLPPLFLAVVLEALRCRYFDDLLLQTIVMVSL